MSSTFTHSQPPELIEGNLTWEAELPACHAGRIINPLCLVRQPDSSPFEGGRVGDGGAAQSVKVGMK
jgi:hypothetical protein